MSTTIKDKEEKTGSHSVAPKATSATGHAGTEEHGGVENKPTKVKPHMSASDGSKAQKTEKAKGTLYINKSGQTQLFENANGDHVHVPDGFCVTTEQVPERVLEASDWLFPYEGDPTQVRLAKNG